VNYIDDLVGAEVVDRSEEAFQVLGDILQDLGLQKSVVKCCPPGVHMVFLGVLFNTVSCTLSVSVERLEEILQLLDEWLVKEVVSKQQVQSLVGKLNFVASCVRPGRVFVSRMLDMLRGMGDTGFVPLDVEFRKDLTWWRKYLPIYNGVSMMSWEDWSSPDMVVASDSCLVGCGGFCQGKYFHACFPEFVQSMGLHISALELLSIVVCIKLWGANWRGLKLQILCDNVAAVTVLNTGRSHDAFMQDCLREVCFYAAMWEFELRSVHLPGVQNRIPDLLSRWELEPRCRGEFFEASKAFDLVEYSVCPVMFRFSHTW
jgi:hypothetical protein